ncbi:MAG TPA: ATP-binding protein [Verrucomicrobiae bacterium]|jgi:signal transduction histidine kinase|nr:ATP-binding protein [Verrucomicrobiae bacterium]
MNKAMGSLRSGTAAMVALVLSIVAIATVKTLANNDLEHDIIARYGMRADLQRAFVAAIDQETGVHGYVATRQRIFLQPYDAATKLIDGYFATLRADSDPAWLADVGKMERLHARWSREVAVPLIAHPKRPDALRIAVRGKNLMDEIRVYAQDFRQKVDDRVQLDVRRNAYLATVALLLVILCTLGFGSLGLRFERARLSKERQLRRQIAQRNLDLERSNRSLEEFAYIASHDLQEPLRTVASFTQLLSRRYAGKLDAQADEFIGYAVDGVKRMQALIDDILEYSRITTHGSELLPVDLNGVLAAVLANLHTSIAERGARVDVGILPSVTGDGRQLGQLFQNLIANALKYNRSDSPAVTVRARRPNPGQWEFGVSDNGIGISPENHERIFGIFARLHTREEYGGTGIGLSICKRIVERHGGRMWVESEEGKGATFYFTLPTTKRG